MPTPIFSEVNLGPGAVPSSMAGSTPPVHLQAGRKAAQVPSGEHSGDFKGHPPMPGQVRYGARGESLLPLNQPHRIISDDAFPELQRGKPTVNVQPQLPSTFDVPKVVTSKRPVPNLEDHMRNMILHNEHADVNSRRTEPNLFVQMPEKSSSVPARPSRRANQAERRQRNAEVQQPTFNVGQVVPSAQNVAMSSQQRIQQPRRGSQRGHGPSNALPPTGRYSASVAPHLRGQQQSTYAKQEQSMGVRPSPQNRQLFEPNQQRRQYGVPSQSNHHWGSGNDGNSADVREQIQYVEFNARTEVLRAGLSSEELENKQRLKTRLEEVCRKTVARFEAHKDPEFAVNSVELKCFGSLSTTFAMKGSDMDLVLLSPHSIPDASSPGSALPRLIEKALLDEGFGARLLTKTRVPIIKFCQEPTSDLAQHLSEARLRWEKELEAPPLEQKKNPTTKSKPTHVGTDTLDPTMPQNRPNSILEYIHFIGGQLQESSSQKGHSVLPDTGNPRPIFQSPPLGKTINRELIVQELTNLPTRDLEGDDTSLKSKTDEERARLYRLAMKEEWYKPAERRVIKNFIEAYENNAQVGTLDEARRALEMLPNVLRKYRPPPEKHLDFPKDGVGIQCDINFSNLLALHNSALLRCYAYCDPRVRPIVLFIKAWAKKRKINSAYESTLSSYGYVLMVLHYLINIASPPLIPNLQHFPLIPQDKESSENVMVDGYNVQFFRNEKALQELAAQHRLTQNQESIGSLIRGFFQYFGSDGWNNFHWMQDVLSLRTIGGILTKQGKGWIAAKTETMGAGPGPKETKEIRQRYLIAIEDPFEIHHNVGRTVSHDGIVAIRDEFRRANRLIQGVGAGKDGPEELLAEAGNRGNLQYRFFGPRPRKHNVKVSPNERRTSGTPAPGHKMESAASTNAMARRATDVPIADMS